MTAAGSLPYAAYRAATVLFRPAARLYLRRRLRRGKEDAARLGERIGEATLPRPPGRLVWLHGASIGEALALLPLIERLVGRGLGVLATTGTVSSARILADRLPAGAVHQFVPLDVPVFVERFLAHWRPDLVLLAESELWPNLVVEVGRRNVPLAMVNARMSRRSFARWRRMPGLIALLLGQVTLCLAQTRLDATRLARLGAPLVEDLGNLKFDGPPPPVDDAAAAGLRDRTRGRPVWLAASIHADEEAAVLATHRRVAPGFPGLLTLVVPRQVERGSALSEQATSAGMTARLRSRGEALAADTDIYIADTMGELGLFYRLAPIAFVGKSLGGSGGQNPIEPAKLGCAILHGPAVANFSEVYRLLGEAGGAVEVADASGLADAVAGLLGDADACAALAEAARDAVAREDGATDRILHALGPLLDDLATAAPS